MTNQGGGKPRPYPVRNREYTAESERDAMEAAEILERARASGEEPPPGWLVLPLLKNKLTTGILGWAVGSIIGFGLFAFIASATIPYNYQHGFATGCFSAILLGVALFIGLGSLWALASDVRRLQRADRYLIVITPDEFVKQEGNNIVHVPLSCVRYV